MKNILINTISGLALLVLFTTCATRIDFPVSDTVPAADITAKVKSDKSDNYQIELEANHLADPERLNGDKKVYVVWVITEDNRQQNLGALSLDSDKSANMEALTPFKPSRILITAEEEATVNRPGSMTVFQSERIKL